MTTDDIDKNSLSDDLKIDLDSKLSQDLSLDAPDLEPAPSQDTSPQKSQAVKDLEGLEDLGIESKTPDPVSNSASVKIKMSKDGLESFGPRSYRWFLVHLLSLLGLVAWALGAFLTSLPYRWEAALIALAVAVLTIPTIKTFRIRTRAGLAGLGAAIGLAICSLYNPDDQLLPGLPLALVWLLLLSAIWVWLIVAILRDEELKKTKVALILSILLIYPILAPIFSIVNNFIFNGLPISDFNLTLLNQSPTSLTNHLPWFFWPQTFLAFLIPPLAAIFLLRSQLKNRKKETKKFHPGALWLAVAGFVVLIYSFFSISPIHDDYPGLASSIRGLWPAASQYQTTLTAKTTIAVKPTAQKTTPVAQTEPATQTEPVAQTEPATQTEPVAQTEPATLAEPTITAQTSSDTTATEPPTTAETTVTAELATQTVATAQPESAALTAHDEPTSGTQSPATTDGTPLKDVATAPAPATEAPSSEQSPAPSADSDIATMAATVPQPETTSVTPGPDPEARESQSDTDEQEFGTTDQASGQSAPPTEDALSQTNESSAQAILPSGDEVDKISSITPTSLEVGPSSARFAPVPDGEDSAAIVVLPPDNQPTVINNEMADQIQTLIDENNALRNRISVLEAQNELLLDRLNYNDRLIMILTSPR
jgi:hypothetical protein